MSYGDFTWTAPFTGIVSVECLGASGSGYPGGNNPFDGGGGGGGAYALKRAISVVATTVYNLRVGAPGNIAAAHDTWFQNTGVVLADFGQNGSFSGTALGGQASSSVGDTKYSGGSGQAPDGVGNPGSGKGGGACANRFGPGANGSGSTGGAPFNGSGKGGDGSAQNSNLPGQDGKAPGGGGGGGGSTVSGVTASSAGAEGAVLIWHTGGSWPPPGPHTAPVVFGTAPTGNPLFKSRGYSFMMRRLDRVAAYYERLRRGA